MKIKASFYFTVQHVVQHVALFTFMTVTLSSIITYTFKQCFTVCFPALLLPHNTLIYTLLSTSGQALIKLSMQTYACSGREDRSVTGQMRTYPESHCIIQGHLKEASTSFITYVVL